MTYDATEQDAILETFGRMLADVTKDGGRKRAAGTKPPWWRDVSHESAIFSHLNKWKHGHIKDPDSGAHPLVHLAWRALAVAYQETYGLREPYYGLDYGGADLTLPDPDAQANRDDGFSPFD